MSQVEPKLSLQTVNITVSISYTSTHRRRLTDYWGSDASVSRTTQPEMKICAENIFAPYQETQGCQLATAFFIVVKQYINGVFGRTTEFLLQIQPKESSHIITKIFGIHLLIGIRSSSSKILY